MKTIIRLFIFCTLMASVACRDKNRSTSYNVKYNDFPAELVGFSASVSNPVFMGTGANTWDKKIRERGFILYEDSLYKMWYTGYNPDIAKEKHLGYATSTDGIHWARYSEQPVFMEKWTEDVFVIKNNGTYYMFAEGDQDVAHLLMSSDGIQWQEKGDLVILTSKGDTIPGPYGTPSVFVENDRWYLFYERNDSAIWLAVTKNKITWKNVQDEPVMKPGPDVYDIAAVAVDQVVKYNNRYYMYYHATSSPDWQHPASPVVWNSDVAMSADLVNWVKFSGNPIVQGDHSSPILVFDGKKASLYTMHSEVWRFDPE